MPAEVYGTGRTGLWQTPGLLRQSYLDRQASFAATLQQQNVQLAVHSKRQQSSYTAACRGSSKRASGCRDGLEPVLCSGIETEQHPHQTLGLFRLLRAPQQSRDASRFRDGPCLASQTSSMQTTALYNDQLCDNKIA
jgi:hypothetical protein